VFLLTAPCAGETDQILLRWHRRVCLERDIGVHVLAMYQIAYADDGGGRHGGVLEQRVLDFLGRDIRAVVDDQLLPAAAEGEIACLIRLHNIAGIQPAVVHDSSGGRRIPPIANGQTRSADPRAACGTDWQLLTVLVADREANARSSPSDGPNLHNARGRVAGDEAGFSHAVGLVDHLAGQLGEFARQLRWHLVTTRSTKSKRVEVPSLRARVADQAE